MTIIITSIKLRHWWNFFRLSYLAMGIVKQTKTQPGFIAMKNTGFGFLHYTMSAWNGPVDSRRFASSGAHLAAMKISGQIAAELKVHAFEGEAMPKWKDAKLLVGEKGRVYSFQ
jgi:hypothetical protein